MQDLSSMPQSYLVTQIKPELSSENE